MYKPEVVVNTLPILGESPVWDEATGLLYFIDILGHRIFRLRPGDARVESVDTGEDIGFCVLTQKGRIVAGLDSGFYYIDFASGEKEFIASPPECSGAYRINDGKCDAAGRIWAGTLASAWDRGEGQESMTASLYCLDERFHLTARDRGIVIPNGLGFSPDRKYFYFADTYTRVVTAYDFDLDTGSISAARPAVTLPEGTGMPDGLTVDDDGMLWVCHLGGSCVVRYDPFTGKVLDRVELPAERITCCAFGGSNMDELYITTARIGVDDLDSQPEAGALFCIRPGVTGIRSFKFQD